MAASTALLIFAGGLVTSTGSGLSVPDWPNTYGWFMWSFPLSKMVGGIFYEHAHRLIASTVGFLIVVLAIWLHRAEPRRWVRRLGYLALAAVITQGVLGGITVLWYLPDPISIAHASLAQIVFCLTVSIALATSPGWRSGYGNQRLNDAILRRITVITTAAVYIQIVIGATMRHTGAGLAIPDFPLAFGHLIPPMWDAKIAIHFAHRMGALTVATLVLAAVLPAQPTGDVISQPFKPLITKAGFAHPVTRDLPQGNLEAADPNAPPALAARCCPNCRTAAAPRGNVAPVPRVTSCAAETESCCSGTADPATTRRTASVLPTACERTAACPETA